MTFVRNPPSFRGAVICDPDRNIELVSLGGGSEGQRYYQLSSQFDEAKFSGHVVADDRWVPTAEQLASGIKKAICWEIAADDRVFRYGLGGMAPLRSLIVDAFKLYGYAGTVADTEFVSVTFKV